jgi:hypothetical protein
MTWINVTGTAGIATSRPSVSDLKCYEVPKPNSCGAKKDFICNGGDGRYIKAESRNSCKEQCTTKYNQLIGKLSEPCKNFCRRVPRWECGRC